MLLYRFVAQGELFRDLASAEPLCDELHHFALAIAEAVGIRVSHNDVDALARHRGENIDFLMRLSAGYTKQFATDAFGDYKRVSLASFDQRPSAWIARAR